MTTKQALNQIEDFIRHELLSLSTKEDEAREDHLYQQAQSFLDQQDGMCKIMNVVLELQEEAEK